MKYPKIILEKDELDKFLNGVKLDENKQERNI